MKLSRLLIGLVVSAVVVAALAFGVFPTRAYLDQREELTSSSRRVQVLEESAAALQRRVDELGTDAEIERLAREQHNLIRPGEEAFALLPSGAAPATAGDLPKPVVRVAPREEPNLWQRIRDRLNFWD